MDFPITVTIPFNDYAFMCQMASENNTTPELFASGILAQTMDEYRDEARWADNQEQLDLVASNQENLLKKLSILKNAFLQPQTRSVRKNHLVRK